MPGRILPTALPQKSAPQPDPPAAPTSPRRRAAPSWQPGGKVRWQNYRGTFLRKTIDGQVEVLIGTRTYRMSLGELRPG